MKVQVCFTWVNPAWKLKAEGPQFSGAWVDYTPATPIPEGEYPDDVLALLSGLTLQEGAVGIRVITGTETWTFRIHPTWGIVPRLEMVAGEVIEVWPLNSEVGGTWEIPHVLPDGNILPMMYVQTFQLANVVGGFMAETPTTVQQWNWFAEANQPDRVVPTGLVKKMRAPLVLPKDNKPVYIYDCSQDPVTMVSYLDAVAFAQWAGVDLPTEEQWLVASGMSPSRKYPWGNQPPTTDRCHCSVSVAQEYPDKVYARPLGASPFGCLDMVGNVWEMCKPIKE